jgi:hypothetical protein
MSDFVLVDLYSQRTAVKDHVKGWRVEDVIDWMKRFGTVTEHSIPVSETQIYIFRSEIGLVTAFCFGENDKFEVLN